MSRALVIVAAVAAALVLGLAGTARAEPTARARAEAKSHFERGSRLYQQGHYAEAVAELEAGYALDPRPDFLYALGQAERKRGDCKAAIGYYQSFVDSGPTAQRTVAVLVQIDRCKQELAAAPANPAPAETPSAPPVAPPSVTPTAPPAAPVLAATPPPPASARPPIYKRWWLWTAVAGVVVAGAGVGVGVALWQRSSGFNGTLPDLVIGQPALVRF
jgi:hypothetical protein